MTTTTISTTNLPPLIYHTQMEGGMVDPGFPTNQPVASTTTTTTTIYFDKSYLNIRNIPAVLKGVVMVRREREREREREMCFVLIILTTFLNIV